VFVNGQPVVDDAELTFRLPGRVLMTGGPRPPQSAR
jgi:hypothetical protein